MITRTFTIAAAFAAVLTTVLAGASVAQDQPIGGYLTLLGAEDLTNSSGVRLTSAAAIIAQDRANFHRFGIRHQDDQSDPWFHSRGHRAAIPSLVQVDAYTADIIVRQGALVYIEVYADPTGQMTRMTVVIPG